MIDSLHKYYHCPACGLYAWLEAAREDGMQRVHCVGCGSFYSDSEFFKWGLWRNLDLQQVANISGYLRENQDLELKKDSAEFLFKIPTPTLHEKAGKMLSFLAANNPVPGATIFEPGIWSADAQIQIPRDISEVPFPSDPAAEDACSRIAPYLSGSWTKEKAELIFLLFDSLTGDGLLTKGAINGSVAITAAGWRQVQSRPELQGKVAFVAMSFDSTLTNIWTGPISAGIRSAGYQPFRVDQKEHNDDITDEILAGIRLAKFVVADFTLHRAGVYYEAGFAAGLGKPVIKLVRETDKENIHFDTRQLNHIIWTEADPAGLERALMNRIVATVGPGSELPSEIISRFARST